MADSPKSDRQVTLRELRARLSVAADLSPDLKRYWLDMLPYLSAAERQRLAEILSGEAVDGAKPGRA